MKPRQIAAKARLGQAYDMAKNALETYRIEVAMLRSTQAAVISKLMSSLFNSYKTTIQEAEVCK